MAILTPPPSGAELLRGIESKLDQADQSAQTEPTRSDTRENALAIADNAILEAEKENALNAGIAVEYIVRNGLAEIIETDQIISQAFENIRRGYPDQPSEQLMGSDFRAPADLIVRAITAYSVQGLSPETTTIVLPWRSALAFGQSYADQGIHNFLHVSASRNHETLATEVDFQSGEIIQGGKVVIADPMLATGNTILDSIARIIDTGVNPDQIMVNALVAAPVGIKAVKDRYPQIRVIVGALDEKLNHHGYIVPGLGDFGDRYFSDFTAEQLLELSKKLNLKDQTCQKLAERFKISIN